MPNAAPTPPGQTIIIERRERGGLVRRLLMPLLLLVTFMMLLGVFLTPSAGLPTRLAERYVAGDLTASKVAIIELSGLILGNEVEHVIQQIRQARTDDNIRAVVLRIDSPGGTVTGADRIWRELMVLKRDKPLVASMGSIAASGGYYVATTADYIFAEPTSMTGSIGVIMEIPQLGGLLEKLGVDFEVLKTGEWKDSPSLFSPMTAEERARWTAVLDEAYQRFLRVIAQGRRMPLEDVRPVADGKVFTATEAVRLKLVDAEGYLDDAIRKAWRLARMESSRVIRYARPLDLREALLGLSAPRSPLGIAPEEILRTQIPRMLYLAR